jgi:hypothetical protein
MYAFRLAGAPLTHDNVVMKLLEAGVNVGIGVVDGYAVRNTRFEAAWVRDKTVLQFLWSTLTLSY